MLEHDDIIDRGMSMVEKIDLDDVVSAFVGSLSTKNLPARSAFGSYVVANKLMSHKHKASSYFSGDECGICGLRKSGMPAIAEDAIDKYPYQVQHTNLLYSIFDLETFMDRKVDVPSEQDVRTLRAMIESLRTLPKTAQLADLNKALQGKLKSNKHQRTILLETFGYAGILSPRDQKCYKDEFLSYDFVNSQQPQAIFKRDWAYPVRFWTGEDGVDEKNLDYYFSKYL